MKKTKAELQARIRELQGEMDDLSKDAEKADEFAKAEREFKCRQAELVVLNMEEQAVRETVKKNAGDQLRELLIGQRTGSHEREITLGAQGVASGAIALTVKDLVPNLEEGNGLPSSLAIVTGVIGNAVFPTDASDMELEVAGEIAEMSDQVIDFDKVQVSPHRVTLSCDISNSAIDNLDFDILAHAQKKFNKAWRKILATHVYSQGAFTTLKGGFSGLAKSGDITLGAGTAYKSILEAVASFTDKGFDAESLCITIDAVTEAQLKMEPKQKGVAGYVIEGGKLCGYEYTVSSKLNTVLGTDSKTAGTNTDKTKLYPTTSRYLGIGYYDYLKLQQHGEVRMSFDATSKAMAKKNCVNMTMNTEISLTDLSNHIYDENGKAVKAFALYEIQTTA